MDFLTNQLNFLDNNIVLMPICMLMMNITGRNIMNVVPDSMFQFVTLPLLQPFIFFFLFYVATRKFLVSLTFSIVIYYIITIFFNEDSEYCIIPRVKTDQNNPTQNSSEQYFKNKFNVIQSNIGMIYSSF